MTVPASRALAILVIGLSLTAAEVAGGVFVSIDANPPTVPADGKSCSQVLVTVLDQSGAPVADDKEVRLATSAGDIIPVVYTTGGRAVAILTSSPCPQIAVISAAVDGVSASTQVEFSSSEFDGVSAGGATIRMTGGSLAYCMDQDTILGSGGVEIEYKGVTIRAASAQVCQTSGQIRAQGYVSVARGDRSLTADALACDIRSDRIYLLDSEDQSGPQTFDIKLRPIDAHNAQGNSQDLGSLAHSSGNSWIISERLLLLPGDKILFYKASIYVGDSKVIKVPYYAYSYQKRESILQQVRYTSSDGVHVDLPFYYQMTDSSIGALKLRYAGDGNESGGYLRPRKGLSMGLEQDYSLRGKGQGRLFIDSIGSSTQAFELAHHLDFGSMGTGGRADISARYQPWSSYAKALHNTTLSLMGNTQAFNYSVCGYFGGSRIRQTNPLQFTDYFRTTRLETRDYVDQSSCAVRAVFRPRSPILSGLLGRISPSLTVGYGSLADSSRAGTSACLYQSLGLGFSRGPSVSRRTSVSFDGATVLTLTGRGQTGAALRVGPTLRTCWMGGSASIGCTMNLHGGTTDSTPALAKYQLGCNLFLSGSRWNSLSSVTYGLDSGRLNLYSSLNYHLAKRWQVRSTYSLYWYAYTLNNRPYRYRTSYLKAGVYRPLGLYEIGLAWSPDGQDCGIDTSKHIWLELNASR